MILSYRGSDHKFNSVKVEIEYCNAISFVIRIWFQSLKNDKKICIKILSFFFKKYGIFRIGLRHKIM